MILLVDVGNSRIKWAQVEDLDTSGARAVLRGEDLRELEEEWRRLARPDRVVVASVAGGDVERELREWMRGHWGREPEYVRARAQGFGIVNRYTEPERLGADRWAALIGARELYPGPACIVDCGTALTFNAMTAAGEFLGGCILPGLTTARRCLTERTHAIGAAEGVADHAIATTTADAVAAGTAIGLAGAIERIADDYRAVLGNDMRTILTGGEAARLVAHVRRDVVVVPDLVLRGLGVIARTGE